MLFRSAPINRKLVDGEGNLCVTIAADIVHGIAVTLKDVVSYGTISEIDAIGGTFIWRDRRPQRMRRLYHVALMDFLTTELGEWLMGYGKMTAR